MRELRYPFQLQSFLLSSWVKPRGPACPAGYLHRSQWGSQLSLLIVSLKGSLSCFLPLGFWNITFHLSALVLESIYMVLLVVVFVSCLEFWCSPTVTAVKKRLICMWHLICMWGLKSTCTAVDCDGSITALSLRMFKIMFFIVLVLI